MTHVTCRPTAKNQDQLRSHTLGNRAWASFTFFIHNLAYQGLPAVDILNVIRNGAAAMRTFAALNATTL